MSLRDMIRIEKKDFGKSIGVDTELSVVSVVTLPYSAEGKSRLDLYEEARDIALKQIDEDVFGEARRAFDVFVDVVVANSNPRRRDPKLMEEIEKAYEHMRQTLSIYSER